MSIGITDIFLLVGIVGTLIVGFFWGAARSLMFLAAWLLAFLIGAYLQLEAGSYLADQWTNYDASFNVMAAFGLIFVGILIAAPILIVIATRGSERVSRFQVLDDTVGALFAVFVAVLSIAGVMIILGTYYETPQNVGTDLVVIEAAGGPGWTAHLYESLLNSNIGSGIERELIPIIETVLGPVLPADVRETFG